MARRLSSLSSLHSHMTPSLDPRNENLNAAFQPPWANGDDLNRLSPAVNVPQGDTRIDPMMGTGWDRWLDMLGASRPGGVNLSDRMSSPGGRLPTSPMEMPSTAFTGEEANSPYGETPAGNRLQPHHHATKLDAPMPATRFTGNESNSPFGATPGAQSLASLQQQMAPNRRRADNIVWGS